MLHKLIKKIHWYHLFYLFVLGSCLFLFAKPIDLTNQDIGRHLANGRELIQGNFEVLSKNYYSHTDPNHAFINHHWLFGLIAFLIYKVFGFIGLHLAHIALLLWVSWLLLKIMIQESSDSLGFFYILPAIILISLRTEIRPESVGLLFLIHLIWQLRKTYLEKKISNLTFFFLLLQQIFWVNTHISFFLGIALPCLLLFSTHFLNSPKIPLSIQKKILQLSLLTTLSSLLNPNFILGFFQPLTIFTDYGYSVFENQTLLYLWQVVKHQTIFLYLFFSILTILLLVIKGKKISFFEVSLSMIGIVMGFIALRNIAIYTVFVFPVLAKLSKLFITQSSLLKKIQISSFQKKALLSQLYVFILILVLSGIIAPHASLKNRRIGLLPGQANAANFIKEQNLSGPIFNNYDLGSYLIFHHPDIKVFTDNRPEAYGKNFFKNIYIPMQIDPLKWEQEKEKYQIKTIIFGTQDITFWAKAFLNYISQQEEWKLIYQDEFIGIWIEK